MRSPLPPRTCRRYGLCPGVSPSKRGRLLTGYNRRGHRGWKPLLRCTPFRSAQRTAGNQSVPLSCGPCGSGPCGSGLWPRWPRAPQVPGNKSVPVSQWPSSARGHQRAGKPGTGLFHDREGQSPAAIQPPPGLPRQFAAAFGLAMTGARSDGRCGTRSDGLQPPPSSRGAMPRGDPAGVWTAAPVCHGLRPRNDRGSQ